MKPLGGKGRGGGGVKVAWSEWNYIVSAATPSAMAFAGFEYRAANLLRDTRRVLVYGAILKTKPAEAFLALLRSLQQNSKDNILSDYSKFYQELSKTKCRDWKDFVLEEVVYPLQNLGLVVIKC